ncbi:hypothetical protein ACHAWF_005085 [Thalassiosira exigua]
MSAEPDDMMEKASKLKEEGTKEFLARNYSSAANLYRRAAGLLSHETELYVKCYANEAACHVKEKSWYDVIHCCDRILEERPDEARSNIKLLYRRGLAKMRVGELKDSKSDLAAALALDDGNKDVRRAIRELRAAIAASKAKERASFGGMFEKLDVYGDKSFNLLLVPTARFPDVVLATVAGYLTKTERGLVAVAMTASASTWSETNWKISPSEASRIVAGAKPTEEIKIDYGSRDWKMQSKLKKSYQQDFFDVEDIDKCLASRLTDGDIGGLLVCLDAVHTLKKFKLNGCVDIVGHGLEPLRGSTVLEQLDLSLVPSDGAWGVSPVLVHVPSISDEAVVPLLGSLIGTLKHLQLPKKWRVGQSALLTQFLDDYNRELNNREIGCSHKHYGSPPCGSTCAPADENPWIPQSGEHYGIMPRTCYACNKSYCEEHEEDEILGVCESCEKAFCSNCHKSAICDSCYKLTCWHCTRISTCALCEMDLCADCCQVFWCDGCDEPICEECSPFFLCDHSGCNSGYCTSCSDDDEDAVKECSTCKKSFCFEHLISNVRGWEKDETVCEGCSKRALSGMERKNKCILSCLRALDESFESDLESTTISKLLSEQKRMRHRWIELYSEFSEEQKKKIKHYPVFQDPI